METQFLWRAGLALTTFVIAACGAESPQPSTEPPESPTPSTPVVTPVATTSASPTGSALPRIQLPVGHGETVEGLLDVDGHDIYARCTGSRGAGSPTIVYFTGWAPDLSKRAVSAIAAIEAEDGGEHRICSYERRNTGRSDTVKGTQKPEDIVADVDGVLEDLGEDGPFVLLGASFGGLVAGAYAVAHPDRIAGILLLDSSIPDDYLIDQRHGFEGMCLEANRQADAWDSLEKVDNCQLAKWAYDRRGREPEVPLIYLAAHDDLERGAADDDLRKSFVRRWSPGIWQLVDAPHWMDEADPELVVKMLERVIALAR